MITTYTLIVVWWVNGGVGGQYTIPNYQSKTECMAAASEAKTMLNSVRTVCIPQNKAK
jgi:hypothetical protein